MSICKNNCPYDYKKLEKQLEKAEEVIRFYGDKCNWIMMNQYNRTRIKDDDIRQIHHQCKWGGLRAENYLKEKEGGKYAIR